MEKFKKIFAAFGIFLMMHSAVAQVIPISPGTTLQGVELLPHSTEILPGTNYCQLGTDQNPRPYCVDATPCKTIDGKRVCLNGKPQEAGAFKTTATCWQYSRDYTCLQYQDTCASLASMPNCKLVKEYCSTDASGNELRTSFSRVPSGCIHTTREYECITKEASTETRTISCDVSGTMNGLTWTTSSPSAEGDFMNAVMAQEFVRQIATGNTGEGFNGLFVGTVMKCREGWFGLRSCCKVGGAGGSNYDFAKNAGMHVQLAALEAGAQYAAGVGSAYVFDFMVGNPQYISQTLMGWEGAAHNFSTSGVGIFGFGTTAQGAGGFLFGATGSMPIGATGLHFNPYAFAIQMGIQIIMALMACNTDERTLGQARANNLCERIGTYCSKEINLLVTKVCVEDSTSFCCYNGLLAKGLQQSAKKQLGITWGSPQDPVCGGNVSPNKHAITLEQLGQLDFTHPSMQQAMAPFENTIREHYAKNVRPAVNSGQFSGVMQDTGDQRTDALCQQRKRVVPSTVCN